MRVLLCRARSESLDTARTLATLGYDTLVAPVLTTVSLPFTLPEGRPDALLATSARAVEALGQGRADRLLSRPVFAVGARTAEAFRDLGFSDVRAAEGDARGLAAVVVARLPRGSVLLYLAGRIRRPDLEKALTRDGYGIVALETYEAREADPWDRTVRAAFTTGEVAACLHYSARSAALALAFADRSGCGAAFATIPHVCLSETVAAALRCRAVDRVTVAEVPSEASLMQALAATIPPG